MVKTNYVIIKSIRIKDMSVNIQIRDRDGYLKYLGVMIDDCFMEVTHFIYLFSNLQKYWDYI